MTSSMIQGQAGEVPLNIQIFGIKVVAQTIHYRHVLVINLVQCSQMELSNMGAKSKHGIRGQTGCGSQPFSQPFWSPLGSKSINDTT